MRRDRRDAVMGSGVGVGCRVCAVPCQSAFGDPSPGSYTTVGYPWGFELKCLAHFIPPLPSITFYVRIRINQCCRLVIYMWYVVLIKLDEFATARS
jgi:hypothetical protein